MCCVLRKQIRVLYQEVRHCDQHTVDGLRWIEPSCRLSKVGKFSWVILRGVTLGSGALSEALVARQKKQRA